MYEQMVNDEPGLEEYSADSDSEVSNPHESDDVSINVPDQSTMIDLMHRIRKRKAAIPFP